MLALATAASACATGEPGPAPAPPTTPAGGLGSTAGRTDALAARAAHTATVIDGGRVLVAGGCSVDGCSTASADAFVVQGSSTVVTGSLGEARDAHTATALAGGRVLVTGGFAREGAPPLASAEVYDPSTGVWSPTATPLSTRRGGHVAARLGTTSVLVAGGWVASRTYTDTTEIFDPATGRFGPGPRLPVPVDGLAAATLLDGSVLLTGGQAQPGAASDLAVVVSPDGTSQQVEPMRQARFKHASVTLSDGRVLVVGGTPDDQALLTSTEVFDPNTQRFSAGPELTTGRYKLAGGVLATPDGRVVVAGGGTGAEIVDLRTGRSTRLASVPPIRLSFSTLVPAEGAVRIIGGYDEAIRLTRTDLLIQLPPRA